ncbi:MAG TPA: aspartyl/asparaginyl beta-hydroxylase domain-containing protein [Steroidobacteraceae bacterium]|nr:aspartyl/asparaginyl beta-hydroxylase domain-containing protein [Steroidobacteraceae bacterium]
MKNFRRIAQGMDPKPALRELAERPELWEAFTVRQDYAGSAHRDTKMIPLRGPTRLEDISDNLDSVDFDILRELPCIFDLLCRAAHTVQARDIGRVMAVKLLEGAAVTPHTDEGRYARYFARFHLVLSSSPTCWFFAGGEKVNMAPGELWWFNHQVEHEVRNGGPERIHLIMDATAPGYTGALGMPA